MYCVQWWKGMKFKEISEAYASYVRKNYGNAYIVFDGYDEAISTKSNTHATRSKSKGSSQNIIVQEENEEALYSKERFLSNNHNKGQLISLLSEYLTSDGQMVHICRGGADPKIVSTALELSEGSNVVLAADDTDVGVMLLYHYQNQISDIYFLQERGKKCWSIKEDLKEVTCKEHLLFIHAWSGCDTTSSIFRKVKVTFMKMAQKSENVQSVSEVMCDYCATKEEISVASMKIFVECMVVQRIVC